MIPANLYPLFQHMSYNYDLTLLGTELQEIRDVVMLGDTIPTTTNNMTTAIEKLKEAVAKVRRETGDKFIFACVEFGGWNDGQDSAEFRVYRTKNHSAATLEEAIAKAIAFDEKAERMAKAAALRAQAAELEAGAK